MRNTPRSLHHSVTQRFILVFHDSLHMCTDVDYMYKLYIHIHYLLPVVEVRSRIIVSLHEYKQFIQYNYYPRIQPISQGTCSSECRCPTAAPSHHHWTYWPRTSGTEVGPAPRIPPCSGSWCISCRVVPPGWPPTSDQHHWLKGCPVEKCRTIQ